LPVQSTIGDELPCNERGTYAGLLDSQRYFAINIRPTTCVEIPLLSKSRRPNVCA